MAYRFDHKHKKHLDSPERRAKIPPKETLVAFHLKRGDWIADIGAGTGYFSFPAAQVVGSKGRVFAVDIAAEILVDLKVAAETKKTKNIITVLSSGYDLSMVTESVDFVLISNVVHEVEDILRFLGEADRILKPGGRLAVIEWKKEISTQGPPESHRISEQQLRKVFTALNYESQNCMSLTEDQYALTAKKKR